MSHASLAISPRPELVRIARMLSVALARRSGLPEPLLDEVRLAVGEAVSRAVLINSRRAGSEPVRLTFTEDDRGFEVAVGDCGDVASIPNVPTDVADSDHGFVTDFGNDFDFDFDHLTTDDLTTDDAAGGTPAGLDLALVAGMADEMVVAANPAGGTVVRLRWTR